MVLVEGPLEQAMVKILYFVYKIFLHGVGHHTAGIVRSRPKATKLFFCFLLLAMPSDLPKHVKGNFYSRVFGRSEGIANQNQKNEVHQVYDIAETVNVSRM
jgi:hypothetical protein